MRPWLFIGQAAVATALCAEPAPPPAPVVSVSPSAAEAAEVSVEASARKLLTALDTQLATVTARWNEANAEAQDPTLPAAERDVHRAQVLRLETMLKKLTEQRNAVIRLFPDLAPRPSPPRTAPP